MYTLGVMGADWFLYTNITINFKDGTSKTKQVDKIPIYFEDSLSSSGSSDNSEREDPEKLMNAYLKEKYPPRTLFQNEKWVSMSFYQGKIKKYIEKHRGWEIDSIIETHWGELRS